MRIEPRVLEQDQPRQTLVPQKGQSVRRHGWARTHEGVPHFLRLSANDEKKIEHARKRGEHGNAVKIEIIVISVVFW